MESLVSQPQNETGVVAEPITCTLGDNGWSVAKPNSRQAQLFPSLRAAWR